MGDQARAQRGLACQRTNVDIHGRCGSLTQLQSSQSAAAPGAQPGERTQCLCLLGWLGGGGDDGDEDARERSMEEQHRTTGLGRVRRGEPGVWVGWPTWFGEMVWAAPAVHAAC